MSVWNELVELSVLKLSFVPSLFPPSQRKRQRFPKLTISKRCPSICTSSTFLSRLSLSYSLFFRPPPSRVHSTVINYLLPIPSLPINLNPDQKLRELNPLTSAEPSWPRRRRKRLEKRKGTRRESQFRVRARSKANEGVGGGVERGFGLMGRDVDGRQRDGREGTQTTGWE